jgi:hypothetical protein
MTQSPKIQLACWRSAGRRPPSVHLQPPAAARPSPQDGREHAKMSPPLPSIAVQQTEPSILACAAMISSAVGRSNSDPPWR